MATRRTESCISSIFIWLRVIRDSFLNLSLKWLGPLFLLLKIFILVLLTSSDSRLDQKEYLVATAWIPELKVIIFDAHIWTIIKLFLCNRITWMLKTYELLQITVWQGPELVFLLFFGFWCCLLDILLLWILVHTNAFHLIFFDDCLRIWTG